MTDEKCTRQFALPGGGTGTCGNVRLCPHCTRRLRGARTRRRTTLTAALTLAAVIGQTARDVPRIVAGRRP